MALILEKTAKNLFSGSPLIHCLTNEITCESVANALLYVNSKPIMADDPREFNELFQQTDGLLLNLGHISVEREAQILAASHYAKEYQKPTVIDVVGISASSLRKELTFTLMKDSPSVVKGNTSEMRRLCDLQSKGRGVDAHESDQDRAALKELGQSLKELTKQFPNTTFLATGETDVIVSNQRIFYLTNGVPELDKMTGTGDIVGALIAALLGQGEAVLISVIGAVSYFNIAGEKAKNALTLPIGLADFRHQLMNQLSLLTSTTNWWEDIRGEEHD